ncbi:hypothetical protein MXAN_6154 [Myxococcus xanthus DK 1622]|uniref:Uncharacterized protein n=2 Tax=Myxococcus TaxID=32 RepID=Q1CZ88_MYXXD|nr:hypothetical protein MXAN_6154 [Myxococcus xanthus DK 1622]NOJ54357.1 hypothetical protein [Myxococcus xanthus]QVW67611.1 hypothetical protein JTM82_35735 [Myxococcus xanthus DZ2]QPM78542.1 hypothetical protein I5Q59_30385 [Myxococcus xanthus]QQR43439.1 hypothetical protein JKA73_31085 [Myxococcus xanthus]
MHRTPSLEPPHVQPSAPQRHREPPRSWWTRFLDFMELSSPEGRWGLGLVLGLLVIGFWPLLLLAVLDVSGTPRKVLVALGPASICLGFALLILVCGYRYGESLRWSRAQTWGLAALFLGMGLAGGAGLWFSEG